MGWLDRSYSAVLNLCVKRYRLILGLSGAVVLGAFLLAGALGVEFLPTLDEGVIWIRANLPAGISLQKSAQIADRIRAIASEYPEVKLVSSQSGRNDAGTDPYGPNRNELFLALNPYDTWPKGIGKRDLINQLSDRLNNEIPGVNLSFTQPIIDNVTEAVTGSAADLAVILRGPDLAELRALAQSTLGVIRAVPGAADTSIEQEEDQAQLRISVDRQAVARYGINARDVQDVIEMAIGGRAATTMFEGERRFDITVRYIQEARADPDAIGKILVTTHEGQVPLSQLAGICVVKGASIIARRENQRQITVRTNIRGRDQGGFVKDAQRRFEAAMKIPAGYEVVWGGQFENLQRAQKRLTFIMPITVAIIFVLLFFMFGSAKYAGIVLMNVPFSLVGGIVALYARGINLSVSAAVGFISLFGVAVMSGVLMIAEINRRRRSDPRTPAMDAVVSGAKSQLRPILLMIVVALLGMVPAARATGIGSDVQRPLATVLVGGLVSSLLLTLVAFPCLYVLSLGRKPQSEPEEA